MDGGASTGLGHLEDGDTVAEFVAGPLVRSGHAGDRRGAGGQDEVFAFVEVAHEDTMPLTYDNEPFGA